MDEQRHAVWWRDYQQWANVECACGNGYFCRLHAIWIPGGDVTSGLALPRERQHEGCPLSHYPSQYQGDTASGIPRPRDREDRRQQSEYSSSPSTRPSTSRLQSSASSATGPFSTVSSSRHRRPRSDRPSEQESSQQQDDYSGSVSGRRPSSRRQSGTTSQTDSPRHRRPRTDRPPTRYDGRREEPAEDEKTAPYAASPLSSTGAPAGINEAYNSYQSRHSAAYDQQSSSYGGSPPPSYSSAVASNTSRARQPPYQQADQYEQPSSLAQQPMYAQRQLYETQPAYTQQPAVRARPNSDEPEEQEYQGRPSYGRQTSPRQTETYVPRYSYDQLQSGQRSDEEGPENQQDSRRQQPYGQQQYPFGQSSTYALSPPYGQQAAYPGYPSHAPYYGNSITAQIVISAPYRPEIDSQDLSTRMGSVRLDDDPYRQPVASERYDYDEDQEPIADEAQATSSRGSGRRRRVTRQ